MKTSFLKSIAVFTASVAMVATVLTVGPITLASAAPKQNVNFGVGVWGGDGGSVNSTGIIDVPVVGDTLSLNASSTVTTGTVKAGDVLTMTSNLVDNATNTGILATMYTGVGSNNSLIVERTNQNDLVNYNWNFPSSKPITRTQTISATDIAHGWFKDGLFKQNYSATSIDGTNTNYENMAGWTNYNLARPTDIAKIKYNVVWKLNGVEIPATTQFRMNVNINFSNTPDGTDINAEEAAYFATSGAGLNAGGCVDTTGLAVGDVLELDYSFTVNGARPSALNSYYNDFPYLNWQVAESTGAPAPGTTGQVTLPSPLTLQSYKFVSATEADITSYNISMTTIKAGDKVRFQGSVASVFPLEYTVASVSKQTNTLRITGSGWTAGSPVNAGGTNYLKLSMPADKSTFELTLTQQMIDGYINAGNKTNVLAAYFYQNSIVINPGKYVFDVKSHKKGDTLNRNIACQSDDVVNLATTKNAKGETEITFQEPTGSKYSAATRHWCQLRSIAGGTVPIGTWIGGVLAVEVTPATTPRTFKCTVGALESTASYQLAIYNQLATGYNVSPQMTWVSFKATDGADADATLVSAGIGSATADTTFSPTTLTYDVTSKDSSTPYPNVVTSSSKATYVVKLGGKLVAKGTPLNLVNGPNVVTIEVTSVTGVKKTYTFNVNKIDVAADATLSSLAFGNEVVTPAFTSSTSSYSATVSSTTTTYPFPSFATSQGGSTVVVKNGGSVVTGPGALALVDGPNVVTVEVTAPNGTSKKTYTMTITKASAAKDATLSGLPTITGVTSSPSFDGDVTSYVSSVDASTTTVNMSAGATANVNGATVTYKLNGLVVTAPVDLKLRPGANVLETTVTATDGTTKKVYTQTINRAELTAGSSTDANDARLAVNPVPGASYVAADGQTVTGFDPELSFEPNVYTKNVPVNQTDVSISAGGSANSGATIVNEYSVDGGLTWVSVTAPATVPLAAGKTTKIRTTVTKGTGTKVYVTDVVRPAIDTTADVGPVEGDGDTPAKAIPGTGKFVASNDSTFQLAWNKATGKLVSQATGIYTGYIEAKIAFTKAGKDYTCTAVFGTLKAMPMKTAAQKTAAMKMKTFAGKQFCIDKIKMDAKTTAPKGGLTKANFVKIKSMNKTAAELTAEKAALAALKGFTGQVQITVTRYRAWPTTMINFGEHTGKGGKISVQVRNTKVNLG